MIITLGSRRVKNRVSKKKVVSYLNICLAPAKKSSRFLLADLLGGRGGLFGKYIQTNRKRNITTPHSVKRKKNNMMKLANVQAGLIKNNQR